MGRLLSVSSVVPLDPPSSMHRVLGYAHILDFKVVYIPDFI
jgi:hypothetical protein